MSNSNGSGQHFRMGDKMQLWKEFKMEDKLSKILILMGIFWLLEWTIILIVENI